MEDKDNLEIDQEEAAMLAKELVHPFNGIDIEDSLTVLNAFTVALLSITMEVNKKSYSTTSDGLEKFILTWMRNCDIRTGLHFGKYINIPDDNDVYFGVINGDVAS